MEETPAYFPAVSLHLSRVLDEIGLNTLTVKRRRNAYLFQEQVSNTHWQFIEQVPVSSFVFGSQTEGTTTPGLNSDLDELFCFHKVNVIESWAQWQPIWSFLMLQEDTAPGYCRLQAQWKDIQNVPIWDRISWAYDSRGRLILKNTWLLKAYPNLVKNGPAVFEEGGSDTISRDVVHALRCISWPDQAGEFISRRRRHDWPSPRLVQQAIKHGVFLVPVGHKLSQTEPLEWRISASMAERCLMFSLGMVHIKCYVVLKMLIKTFIQPKMGKCITSYHCKTALLYCTENTELGFWRDDNLLQCVTRCLVMLLTWVKDGFCPQFILPEENLFAGKVTAQNKDVLKSILTDLIKSKGRALLSVRIDRISLELRSKLNTEPLGVPVLNTLQTKYLVGELECTIYDDIYIRTSVILVNSNNAASLSAMRVAYEQIKTLKVRVRHSDKYERQAIQTYIDFLSGWLGSMLASFSLSHKRPLPHNALQLMRRGTQCDITVVLKLASILYMYGYLHKAEMMLQRVEDHFSRKKKYMKTDCKCYDNPYDKYVDGSFCHMMCKVKGKKARATFFAYCVKFSSQEINCAPPAIQNELYRSAGDDVQHRDPVDDDWMCLGVVDCLPFLFYLQYLTYTQLGKQEQRQRSLRNLDSRVQGYDAPGHLETAWNLLGQCMELEDDPDAALQCYMTSLELRPRNNAANWHVATLCYKQIQERRLLK